LHFSLRLWEFSIQNRLDQLANEQFRQLRAFGDALNSLVFLQERGQWEPKQFVLSLVSCGR
jgi:hypothetical protein